MIARWQAGRRLAADLARVAAARLSPVAPPSQPQPSWNRLFDRRLIPGLRSRTRALEAFDVYLNQVLGSPRLEGQIVFEYGMLLDAVDDWSGRDVLDIGTGRSTLPRFLAAQGATVTTFDLPAPVEVVAGGWAGRVNRWLAGDAARSVRDLQGSLLALPLAASRFDLVTSLSVLEHLDTDLPDRAWVPLDEQARRLAVALDEMVRVMRPGGLVFITSECCDFTRATSDRWRSAYYFQGGPDLAGAWPVQDVRRLFHDYLSARGVDLVGEDVFDAAQIGDPNTWTWRGPYFSVFSLLGRKRL